MREKDIIINKRMKDMGEEKRSRRCSTWSPSQEARAVQGVQQPRQEGGEPRSSRNKKKLKSEGKYGHDVDEKKEKATVKATPAKKGTKKK